MPAIKVVFYQDQPGGSPVVDWLRKLNETNPRAFDKCRAAIARLALHGHELRRPRLPEKLKMPKKSTTDATKILADIAGRDPKRQQAFEEEVANRQVAQQIYQLRQKAGISQAELARRIGTTQSVISRLEDADYEGHSLAMLNRIAAAVERRVEIRFVPRRRRPQAA
jgi:DNA-binding transcriptional regulator YiaG